jgi:hypothetical protein
MANKYFRASNGQIRKAFCECNDNFADTWGPVISRLKVRLFRPFRKCPKCRLLYWYYQDKKEEPKGR